MGEIVKFIVFVVAVIFATSAYAADSIKPTGLNWAKFSGTISIEEGQYILADKDGYAFRIAKKYVRISDTAILVKSGVPATVLGRSNGDKHILSDCKRQDDCPSKCCACIGLVRVCCGSGGTRGICLGAWGCP